MFPTFDQAGIERMQRFGEAASYRSGERIVTAGAPAPGLVLILSGRISVTDRGAIDGSNVIATHAAGEFMGELAQLSDRPSLVNAEALDRVDAFVIRPHRLRDLMVQEAELGERIMRALILRRIGLLESGRSGHVIVGQVGHRDVMRLQGFLARNGQPHHVLDPDSVSCARVLIERFEVDPHHLPIVLCANGKLLRNPSENEMARCIGLVRPIDTEKLYDVAIVGAGPAGLAAAVYAASEGLSVIVLDCRAFGGQAGASARIENYLGFPTGISGLALMARAANQAQNSAPRWRSPMKPIGWRCGTTAPGGMCSASAKARPCRAARSSSRPACAIAGRRSRISRRSKDHRCIIGRPRSSCACATAQKQPWSAPAIPPARPRSTWRAG